MITTTGDALPDGWERVCFGNVVRQSKAKVDRESDGVERYVAGQHMDTDDLRIRRWGEVGDGYLGPAFHRYFKPGQVLYGSRRTYLRKVAVADFDGVCANTTFVVESASADLLDEFLPYVMTSESFHTYSISKSKGSTNPYINFSDLAKYEFMLPPVDEQRRIVDVLENARDICERWRDAAQRSELALRALLERSIAVDYAEGSTTDLGAAADIKMGRIYPSGEYVPMDGEGIRLIRPGNLAPDGRIDWAPDASVRLPEEYVADPRTVTLSAGDVIMNLTAQTLDDGFLGRVCLLSPADAGSILNQRIARLRPATEDLLGEYLFSVLRSSRFRRHTDMAAQGSKIKHLYLRDIEGFRVPVVRRHRQEAVCQEVAAAEALLEHATAHLLETRSLLVLLRESSLRGRS